MAGFIKTTSSVSRVDYNGVRKAALLLCELDSDTRSKVLSKAKLSPAQITLLRKEMDGIELYDSSDSVQVRREIGVLREMLNFMKMRGFEIPETTKVYGSTMTVSQLDGSAPKSIKDGVKENSEIIGKFLKDLLDEDNGDK